VRKQVPSKKATVKAAPKKKAAAASTKAPKAAAAAERPPVPKTRRPKLRMDGSSWLGASPSSKMAPSPVLKVLAATRAPSPPRRKSLTRRNSTPRRRSPPAAADGDDEGDGGTPLVIDGSRPSLSPLGSSSQSAASTVRQLEVHVPAPVRATASASVTPPPPAAPTEALLREQVSTLTKLLAASQSKLLERDGEMPFREVGEVERLAAQLLPFTDAADAAPPQLSAAPRAAWASDDDASSDDLPPLCASLAGFRSALDLGRERAAERDAARDAYDAERERRQRRRQLEEEAAEAAAAAAAESAAAVRRRPAPPTPPPAVVAAAERQRRRHQAQLPAATAADLESLRTYRRARASLRAGQTRRDEENVAIAVPRRMAGAVAAFVASFDVPAR